jgi:hypothetical protein
VAAEIIRQGVRRGELRADIDLETTLDLVFAPIYYRLLYGHGELTEAFAEQSVDHVLRGIASTREDPGTDHISNGKFS